MPRDSKERCRVGVIPLMIGLYDRMLPDLREDLSEFSREIAVELHGRGMELLVTDLVSAEEEIQCALTQLTLKEVDLVVLCHMAYCPSGQILRALQGYNGSLLLWPAQSENRVSSESFDEKAMIRNHGVHGTQDLASVLTRQARPFAALHGFWKDPEFRQSLSLWARAGQALRAMRNSRPLQIAGHFPDMLDLQFDEAHFLGMLGVSCLRTDTDDLCRAARAVNKRDVRALVSQYKKEFILDPDVDEEILAKTGRHELALRRLVDERSSRALGINFLGLCNKPEVSDGLHVAVSRLMAEGIGYGGEGDWITAMLVRGFLAATGRASFSEMFAVDYEGNRVVLRHWGEGNLSMARTKPLLRTSVFKDAQEAQFGVVDFEFAPGKATVVNLCCEPEGQGRLIAIEGEVDDESLPKVDGPRSLFTPQGGVQGLLDLYAENGGTHHLALVSGEGASLVRCMARLAGWSFVQL